MFCQQCGKQNDDTAKFCAHCGAATQEPQEAGTSTRGDEKEASGGFLQGLGSLVIVVVLGYVLWDWGHAFFRSAPQLEFPQGFPTNMVSITDCDWTNRLLYCVVTYNGKSGGIAQYSLAAIGYDENGIKIGDTTFPDAFIGPGQSVKQQFMLDSVDGEITRVFIGPRSG